MIVKMSKVTVLCLDTDRQTAVEALQGLGVLHVVPFNAPKGQACDRIAATRQRAASALAVLGRYAEAAGPTTTASARPPADVVDEVHARVAARSELQERLAALGDEIVASEPFGSFDPNSVRRLAEKGIEVRLGSTTDKGLPTPPDGVSLVPLSTHVSGQYFALIGKAPIAFDGKQHALPSRALQEALDEREQASGKLSTVEAELATLAVSAPALSAHVEQLHEESRFIDVREGMGATGKLAWLQGFCPTEVVERLREGAAQHGWGLLVEEPSPEDEVPTLIRNPAWARPIESLFKVIDVVPGYRETDTSSVFLIAFTLFFAMLVGDAGYGLVFLILTALFRRKFRKAPPEPFRLMYILSIATIVWGTLTCSVFGSQPSLLSRIRWDWVNENERNFMSFCFLLGAIHLTVAHAWSALRLINSTRALADVGWICLSWTMYFAAHWLVLADPLSPVVKFLFVPGLVLVVLFMTPLNRLKQEAQGFIKLPFDVIGNFVDVVSYVRLFAVGSASLAVAVAFNDIALSKGITGPISGLIAALILFIGHAFNIVLCIMSVLVHGIRLNTLEFSSHMGLEWSGHRYAPFARRQPDAMDEATAGPAS